MDYKGGDRNKAVVQFLFFLLYNLPYHRYLQYQRAAPVYFALHLNLAALSLSESLCNGESQPKARDRSGFFAAVEAVEDKVQFFGRDSIALRGVLNETVSYRNYFTTAKDLKSLMR